MKLEPLHMVYEVHNVDCLLDFLYSRIRLLLYTSFFDSRDRQVVARSMHKSGEMYPVIFYATHQFVVPVAVFGGVE